MTVDLTEDEIEFIERTLSSIQFSVTTQTARQLADRLDGLAMKFKLARAGVTMVVEDVGCNGRSE